MDFNQIPILSITTYIPLVGALAIVFLIPKQKTGTIKAFATFIAVLDFVISLPLWWAFDRGKDGYQVVESAEWIPSLGVAYDVGLDGIWLAVTLQTTLMGV